MSKSVNSSDSIVPIVIESTPTGERTYDVYSRLLKSRVIFLNGEIKASSASSIIAQLLFLELEDREADISLYIMSPGGEIASATAIYDTMQHIACDVATYCIGEASSAGAILLSAGAPGKRYALPGARIMIHQPHGGVHGTASEVRIGTNELEKQKKCIYKILAKHTKKTMKQVEQDCQQDYYMSATEAKKYGIIDAITKPNKIRR